MTTSQRYYHHWRALSRCAATMQSDPASHSFCAREAKHEEAADAGREFIANLPPEGWVDPGGHAWNRHSTPVPLQPSDLEPLPW